MESPKEEPKSDCYPRKHPIPVQPDSQGRFPWVPIEASTSESQSTFIYDSNNFLSSIFTKISREVVWESVLAYQNSELAAYALSQDIVKERPKENEDVIWGFHETIHVLH